jgi:hypothetical protein
MTTAPLAPAKPRRMSQFWQTAHDLVDDVDLLRSRRYGMIEVVGGRLARVVLRPWPKLVTFREHWPAAGDRCRLYYNQPRQMPNFLALKYIVSSRDGSYASVRRALVVLDEIARIKGTDAIVCEARNLRLSERLLARFGWQRHCLHDERRHYIKRFYGSYPVGAAVDSR